MKILVIKLGAIGDIIYTTPTLRALKEKIPNSSLTFLTSEWSKDIFKYIKPVDEVISINPHNIKKNILSALFTALKLHNKKFDAILVLHRNKWINRLAQFIGAKKIIGFDYEGHGKGLTIKIPFDDTAHEVDRYLSLIKPLGIEKTNIETELTINQEEAKKFKEYMNEKFAVKSSDVLIAIHCGGGVNPGTYMPIKRWTMTGFSELSKKLNKNFRLVFIGNKDDENLTLEIVIELAKSNFINLTGKTTLAQFVALLSNCSLFIGGDSGPLHIASALNVPTIGIFGPSDPRLVAPRGEKHKFIWKHISCSPCYTPKSVFEKKDFSKCPIGTHECMTAISVDEVYNAIRI